ncbi:DUF2971 domain-containing protein [Cytophagaceae bacterium YF14B1]|uniref:DUF2971 domain-containing protein n=1 Tax=Xanthocytophaga flava TaxID=3048013 RepID=A0AAE3U7M7_9BACT|nr:DUF2971 domain-containing protein [Xanthocytophaga flavus]MDJ1480288.1 DUF2971 domain-containing protein [Xanthocytophaga flavus]
MMHTPEQLILAGVKQSVYPQYIFKFRIDNNRTESIIKTNELWFSNPLDFNDPYDCNTPIKTDTPLKDIENWLTTAGVPTSQIANYAKLLKNNPNIMKEKTEKALQEIGICCFSKKDDSILQWSHYSDYHRGICLKFDITADPSFFTIPIIVEYRDDMQHYNHFVDSQNIVNYLIKPKFRGWSYEDEIRIVKRASEISSNGGKRSFKFKDNALKEIIFGTKATNATIKKYRNLCSIHGKSHVKFFKMELGSGFNYELIKNPI